MKLWTVTLSHEYKTHYVQAKDWIEAGEKVLEQVTKKKRQSLIDEDGSLNLPKDDEGIYVKEVKMLSEIIH